MPELKKYKTQLDVKKLAVITDENMENIITARAKQFGPVLTEKLKGLKIDAFGPKGRGIWGATDDKKEYLISRISFDYADTFHDHSLSAKANRENPKVYATMRVTLDKYRAYSSGLIYTDQTFLKDISKKFKELGFDADVSYTEQGMQGETYVSMSLVCPMDVIAPDVHEYMKVRGQELFKQEKLVEKEKTKPKAKKFKR